MARKAELPRHDAKFSAPVIDCLRVIEPRLHGLLCDPFAGLIQEINPDRTDIYGIEIEPEWADASDIVHQGDALALESYRPGTQRIVTSVVYGNRFSGNWVAVNCKGCKGTGKRSGGVCRACNGLGNDRDKRFGYAASLNRAPSEGSTAKFTFGVRYRRMHFEWLILLAEQVLPPGDDRLVINCSDVYRTPSRTASQKREGIRPDQELVEVVRFFVEAATAAGFHLKEVWDVETARMGNGQNRDARAAAEQVLVFDLPTVEDRLANRLDDFAIGWA